MSTYTPSDINETTSQEFDDADAPQASVINPLGQAAFNTAKWAANRVGTHRTAQADIVVSYGAQSSTSWPQTFANKATFDAASPDPDHGNTVALVFDGVKQGDVFEVDVDFESQQLTGSSVAYYRLAHQIAPTSGYTEEVFPLSTDDYSGSSGILGAQVVKTTQGNGAVYSVHLKGAWAATWGDAAYVRIWVQACFTGGGSGSFASIEGPMTVTGKLWRPNT